MTKGRFCFQNNRSESETCRGCIIKDIRGSAWWNLHGRRHFGRGEMIHKMPCKKEHLHMCFFLVFGLTYTQVTAEILISCCWRVLLQIYWHIANTFWVCVWRFMQRSPLGTQDAANTFRVFVDTSVYPHICIHIQSIDLGFHISGLSIFMISMKDTLREWFFFARWTFNNSVNI